MLSGSGLTSAAVFMAVGRGIHELLNTLGGVARDDDVPGTYNIIFIVSEASRLTKLLETE